MSLALWRPTNRGNLIDEFFNDWFTGPANVENRQMMPAADVVDKGDRYHLEVELPGVKKEDVNIEIKDDSLVIEAAKNYEKKVEEKDYHLRERAYGSFRRSFSLSSHIDREKIDAKYENGILTLELPKKEESVGKRIELK